MIGKLIDLEKHFDSDGKLVVVEKLQERLGFDIKRVYYIFDTKTGFVRGKHAHKSLNQLLICIHGCCVVRLDDGKGTVENYTMNSPGNGLIIGSNIWREMYDFSKDCVLLVLASEYYNEKDYIRNYEEFLQFVNRK